MERKQEAVSITCHNFSDIRRRPLVIGKLDQVRLPFVVTMPQLAVGALTFALLFVTRPAWGAVMSDRLHIVTFVVVPILVAQQVSRTSVEGRTVSKAALGFLRLWLAPHDGEINGRRRRPATTDALTVRPLVALPSAPGSAAAGPGVVADLDPAVDPATAMTPAADPTPTRRYAVSPAARNATRTPRTARATRAAAASVGVSRRTLARRARLATMEGRLA
ncbi:MAG: hypothetical protein AAFO29_07320 [Actinomycetota bacterium]